MKKIFPLFLALYASIGLVYADIVVTLPTDKLPKANGWQETVDNLQNSGAFIAEIIRYTIGVVGILAIIAVTWSAILMFLSVGEEDKFKKARTIMITSLIGVAIAGLAYAIVNLITHIKF